MAVPQQQNAPSIFAFDPDGRIADLENWLTQHEPSRSAQKLREWLQTAYHHPFLCGAWYYLQRRRALLKTDITRQICSLLLADDTLHLEELEYIFRLIHEQDIIQIDVNIREALAERLVKCCESAFDPDAADRSSVEGGCDAVLQYDQGSVAAANAHILFNRSLRSEERQCFSAENDDD